MVAGAIVAAAFQVTVIDTRVKPDAGGIAILLVSDGAKRHATYNARFLVAQNGVVFLASDMGALKPDELVVFWVFNNHAKNRVNGLYNMHLHDFYFFQRCNVCNSLKVVQIIYSIC